MTDNQISDIWLFFKEFMDKKGLSQLEVASGASVTPGAVGRMYRNQLNRIDVTTIDKVTEYLGITDIGAGRRKPTIGRICLNVAHDPFIQQLDFTVVS